MASPLLRKPTAPSLPVLTALCVNRVELMQSNKPHLKDGSEWMDHEDCIVGDEAGLRNLISACETAIEKGEHYGSELGDYVGVKNLESDWFEDPMDSLQTRYANLGLGVVLSLIVGLVFVGIYTVFKWLF